MGKETGIEYCDASWSPWQGCHKVDSEAECKNCYMYRDKKRFGQDPTRVIRSKQKTFKMPLNLKDPAKIFVCSWSDFFIKEADPWRKEAMEIMAIASQHTYIIVTKRSERAVKCLYDLQGGFFGAGDYYPNWWFLVTAGTQKSADKRIPEVMRLRNISPSWPVIGVSVEPMLESMDLSSYLPYLNWTILGGESGPHARPTHPDWVRSIRDQCQKAQVLFFFKQWGQWCPDDFETVTETGLTPKRCWIGEDGRIYNWFPGISSTKQMMWRSRKTAGRLIDGRIWAEVPVMGSNEATERTNSQKT